MVKMLAAAAKRLQIGVKLICLYMLKGVPTMHSRSIVSGQFLKKDQT